MKTSLGKTLKDLLYHTKPILKHKDEEPIEDFYKKLKNYLNNSPPKREGKGVGASFHEEFHQFVFNPSLRTINFLKGLQATWN